MAVTVTFAAPQPNRLTDAGTCRHCGWALRHTTLLDDNDQPVDRYLGANPDHGGALDALCPGGTQRDCEDCHGTGAEAGDPDADWDCQTCLGDGKVADHQPAADPADPADPAALAAAVDLATTDYQLAAGGPDCTARDFIDQARNGATIDHTWVDKAFTDGSIGPDTADAYRAVLDATMPELDAALRQLRA